MAKNIRRKGLQAFHRELELLRRSKKDFIVTKTSSTNTIELLDDKIKMLFSCEYVPMKILSKIQKIKKEILNNADKVIKAPYSDSPFDIKYFDFKPSIYEIGQEHGCYYEFQNVYEADITGAYYKTALNLGFISESLYNECMLVDKKHRMKILGAIATNKSIYHYKQGKIVGDVYSEKNDLTRSAWFKICSYVNNAMQHLKEAMDKNFIFYWVDGIYFTLLENQKYAFDQNQVEAINETYLDLVSTYNFEWKIQKIKSMKVKNIDNVLYMEVMKNNNTTKTFNIPKKRVVYYGFTNESEFYL